MGGAGDNTIGLKGLRDVGYRVITGGLRPDHATIARFRARHEQALGGPFTKVLRLLAATRMGFTRISLETGSYEFFLPARKLYEKFGFEYCGPFADYQADPNSVFMTRHL